jgi:hypothetical protein
VRVLVVIALLALALPGGASAGTERVPAKDRAAINRLLDEFVPDVVAQKNLKRGWSLVAGYARTVSYGQWIRGNTSVQQYPAKGKTFHGWIVNYANPGDVGFDLLLQPTKRSIGAWSFRAEAQRIHGSWKITTWYPVATFAPPGRTQTVLGPNDLGASNASAAGVGSSRLGAWALFAPVLGLGVLLLCVFAVVGVRWARRRSRVREIQRALAR